MLPSTECPVETTLSNYCVSCGDGAFALLLQYKDTPGRAHGILSSPHKKGLKCRIILMTFKRTCKRNDTWHSQATTSVFSQHANLHEWRYISNILSLVSGRPIVQYILYIYFFFETGIPFYLYSKFHKAPSVWTKSMNTIYLNFAPIECIRCEFIRVLDPLNIIHFIICFFVMLCFVFGGVYFCITL